MLVVLNEGYYEDPGTLSRLQFIFHLGPSCQIVITLAPGLVITIVAIEIMNTASLEASDLWHKTFFLFVTQYSTGVGKMARLPAQFYCRNPLGIG